MRPLRSATSLAAISTTAVPSATEISNARNSVSSTKSVAILSPGRPTARNQFAFSNDSISRACISRGSRSCHCAPVSRAASPGAGRTRIAVPSSGPSAFGSTMTSWPSSLLSSAARMRAVLSVALPAACGTISRIG